MEQTLVEQVFAGVDLSGLVTGILAVVAISLSIGLGMKAWNIAKTAIRKA